MKKILITGGAGFIGSAIATKLLNRFEIIIYDNFIRNSLKYINLSKNKNIKIINGSINDKKKLLVALKNIDIVIHTAAIAGVSNYYKNPFNVIFTNYNGTNNLIDCIIKNNGISLLINFSTSEIYGNQKKSVCENDYLITYPPDELRSVYSKSKILSEQLCYCFSQEHKVQVVSLRPFNIYGPGQLGEGAISNFVFQAIRNKSLNVTAKGTSIRAWCYISDIVDVVYDLIINKYKFKFEYFNIGNPKETISTLNLAKKVINISKSKSNIKLKKHIGTDIMFRSPNINKAKKMLGFRPKISLDDGISKTIFWHKKI